MLTQVLLVVTAVRVRFMCVIGLLSVYMLLVLYAFNLPGTHMVTNADLTDLHEIKPV